MTNNIGDYGNPSSLFILNAGINSLQQAQQILTWENSTGTLASTFADLGNNRRDVLDLTPKLTQISAWQGSMTYAQNNLSMVSTSLNDIIGASQTMSASLLGLLSTTNSTSPNIESISQQAFGYLSQIANDLDVSDGNGYAFASSAEPFETPLKNTTGLASSELYKQINQAVQGLKDGVSPDDILQQATKAAADNDEGVSVFSKSLSLSPEEAGGQQRRVVTGNSAKDGQNFGIVATQGGYGKPAGNTSTGSPLRDVIRDMMMVASLKDVPSDTPHFQELVGQIRNGLQDSIKGMISMGQDVGTQQSSMKSQSAFLSKTQTMFTTQLGNARDCDPALVATQLNQVNTTLQASYSMIAKMKAFSLANYL